MRVTLIASPFANLGSVRRALLAVGADLDVTNDPEAIGAAATIVLPGVGSFGAAAGWLATTGVAAAIRLAVERGAALLGICVGHQILFDDSDEIGAHAGLGLIAGSVRRFGPGLPVPQVGWNRVQLTDDPLFHGIEDGTPFYFVNSYRAIHVPRAHTVAFARYGESFVAAVRRGRVAGVQFHPERSSRAGIKLLQNFISTGELVPSVTNTLNCAGTDNASVRPDPKERSS